MTKGNCGQWLSVILLAGCVGQLAPTSSVAARQQCGEWADEMENRMLACGADQQAAWDWLQGERAKCYTVIVVDPLASPEGCIDAARAHSCDPASFNNLWCAAFIRGPG